MSMARKYSNLNGATTLNEEIEFKTLWSHDRSFEELGQKQTVLGIPQEQLWVEAKYAPEKIAEMKQMPSYRLDFEKKLWEGANAASLNSIPLDVYLKRIGLPEDEIKAIQEGIENQSGVPLTGLELPEDRLINPVDVTRKTDAGNNDTPSNIESEKGLNGAQITAAVELLKSVSLGTTAPDVAFELLVSLGIDEKRARKMVDKSKNISLKGKEGNE